ncbi:MAG: ABC transporter ATP-binding protein [Lentilactobacillus buchneri]|nr:ABC transporter ATP-binding protein [Lentilactobacillus buchneri]MCI2019007.1 ABC transporter ATP-binding protein [Lentilactobacillus buchneri]
MLNVNRLDVFIGRKKIINNASFKVKLGSVVGLIGPNGAGKTTIMKTILGLTKFTGSISIAGQTITERQHAALLKVGALIENPAIYPFLTGMQNLKLYSEDERDMNALISKLEMDGYINDKAKGYSLGMKQKLGIAIALLNNPQLVILDEPMNGLDIEATILVRKLIKNYADNGTSFLISSHILSELEKAVTDVVLIDTGNILLADSLENFKHVDRQHYHLLTDNMDETLTLMKTGHFNVSQSGRYLNIGRQDLISVQELLYQNNIHLLELSPEAVNFEQRIVQLLREKQVARK